MPDLRLLVLAILALAAVGPLAPAPVDSTYVDRYAQ
jgi:hypothetical protein